MHFSSIWMVSRFGIRRIRGHRQWKRQHFSHRHSVLEEGRAIGEKTMAGRNKRKSFCHYRKERPSGSGEYWLALQLLNFLLNRLLLLENLRMATCVPFLHHVHCDEFTSANSNTRRATVIFHRICCQGKRIHPVKILWWATIPLPIWCSIDWISFCPHRFWPVNRPNCATTSNDYRFKVNLIFYAKRRKWFWRLIFYSGRIRTDGLVVRAFAP